MIPQSFIFLCFIALLIYSIAKKKSEVSVFVIALWCVVAFFGLLYINASIFYEGRQPLAIGPYVYLFACFLIYVIPLMEFKVESIVPFRETRLMTGFFILCGLISILPFAENFIHTIHSAGDPSAFAEFYDRSKTDNSFNMSAHLSSPGKIFNSITIYFQHISPFLLLYYLTFKRTNLFVCCGLLLFMANPVVFMFAGGARGIPVIIGLCFIAYYLLLRKQIPQERKKVIKLIFLAGVAFVAIIVFYITLSRFADTEFSISEWIYRYLGESMPDFNGDAFHTRAHTNGTNCFPFFQHLIDPSMSDQRNFQHLYHTTGVRMFVYYTFIGDIYIDFGAVFCVVFLLILAAAMKTGMYLSKGNYTLPVIIIMALYLRMGIVGYMFMFTKLQPIYAAFTLILAPMLNIFNAFEGEGSEE